MKGARRPGLFSWITHRSEIERLACEVDALARRRLGGGGAAERGGDVLACLESARSLLDGHHTPEPEAAAPSPVAARLIALRDALLVSKRAGTTRVDELLDGLYTEIGTMLELEGIHTLDGDGRFNPEHQRAVGTCQTSVRDDDDIVCDTVRPGYLLGGTVLRLQDVTILAYQPGGRQ